MTRIQTAPLDVMVYAGTEAKFTCTGTTDPEEVQNLEVNWEKDGDPIDYQVAQRSVFVPKIKSQIYSRCVIVYLSSI